MTEEERAERIANLEAELAWLKGRDVPPYDYEAHGGHLSRGRNWNRHPERGGPDFYASNHQDYGPSDVIFAPWRLLGLL